MYGVNSKTENKELLQALKSQKENFKEAKLSVEYRINTQRGLNVILRLEPD